MTHKPILTLDCGNSAVKAAVVTAGEVVDTLWMPEPEIEGLMPMIERHGVENAIYSTVGRHHLRLIETLRCLLRGGIEVLSPATDVPVKVEYASSSTLGADRVAAACGADALWPGEAMLVVDAGTAITCDFVAGHTFLGGNISPGVGLRLDSLHHRTARLPEVSPVGPTPDFGFDTASAMRSGAVGGAAAEIYRCLLLARRSHDNVRVVMTGGDAPLLEPLLEPLLLDLNITPDFDRHLVAKGLAAIYIHNNG